MGIGRALFLHVGFLDVDDDAAVGTAANRYCKMKDIRGDQQQVTTLHNPVVILKNYANLFGQESINLISVMTMKHRGHGNRCIFAGAGKIVVLRLPGHMIAYVVFSFHKASEE